MPPAHSLAPWRDLKISALQMHSIMPLEDFAIDLMLSVEFVIVLI